MFGLILIQDKEDIWNNINISQIRCLTNINPGQRRRLE